MMTKICKTINSTILTVLIIFILFLGVPRLFGWSIYVMQTGSMPKEIPIGSLIFVKPCDTADIQTGDILTLKMSNGSVVTHRLVSVDFDTNMITTKGDGNKQEDNPIPMDSICGEVVLSIPYLGSILTILKTKTGILLLGGFIMVFIWSLYIPDLLKKEV